MSRPWGSPPSAGVTRPDVELLRWPEDAERVEELRRQGRPRLLLLEAGAAPPPTDGDEDWAWTPIDERDLFARLHRLAHRAPAPGEPDLAAVRLDADDVLRVEGQILSLPPIEAALLRTLLDPPVRVRERADLARAAWGDAPRRRRSLDSRVLALRRHIHPLGLAVHSVRGRGFLLGTFAPRDGTGR